jgi:hypothetical protein
MTAISYSEGCCTSPGVLGLGDAGADGAGVDADGAMGARARGEEVDG